MNRCKKIKTPLQCEFCHETFTCRSSKSKHQTYACRKRYACEDESVPAGQQAGTIINNNITNNNINTINNNIVAVLPLPFDVNDDSFRFCTDHITRKVFKHIWDRSDPAIGFRNFSQAILSRVENQVVKKNSYKEKYNKVHVGNNEWRLELDKVIFPRITQEMSSAALEKVEEHGRRVNLENITTRKILNYLDRVNTEVPEVTEAIEQLMLIVINLTEKVHTHLERLPIASIKE